MCRRPSYSYLKTLHPVFVLNIYMNISVKINKYTLGCSDFGLFWKMENGNPNSGKTEI